MKYAKRSLYLLGLIGSIGVWLPIFGVQRAFFDRYDSYFLVPLWIAIIGLIFIRRYENRQTERAMLQRQRKQ